MTNRAKIIIAIAVILTIGIVIYVRVNNANDKNEEVTTNQTNDDIMNYFDENGTEVENNVIENNDVKTENETVENGVATNNEVTNKNQNNASAVVGKEEQESNTENTELQDREKAVEMEKKEWAISVNSYDFEPELQSEGIYKVTVRNKTDRTEVTRYTVNVKTGEIVEG